MQMNFDAVTIWIFAFFSFCLGACISSFLNVVIWRVPRGESICHPPSHCPKCNSPIPWWCNVPILSWALLKGRCVKCKAPIPFRYILVELLGAALFLCAFWRYGTYAPFAWLWIALMIVGTFIDLDHQLLPDFVTVGGMVYGVVLSAAFWALGAFTSVSLPDMTGHVFYVSPLKSVLGLAVGFGLLWFVRFIGSAAFKREAMGMGDVFLMGAVGAIFGVEAVVVSLVLSSLFGSLVGFSMILLAKTRLGGFTAIPYGPFICAGCLSWMFYGPEIWRWYANLLTGPRPF